MPRHRSHRVEFERQVVAEYHASENLHALARRHALSRNLIRIWVEKAEAGALDHNVTFSELLTAYEATVSETSALLESLKQLRVSWYQKDKWQQAHGSPASATLFDPPSLCRPRPTL